MSEDNLLSDVASLGGKFAEGSNLERMVGAGIAAKFLFGTPSKHWMQNVTSSARYKSVVFLIPEGDQILQSLRPRLDSLVVTYNATDSGFEDVVHFWEHYSVKSGNLSSNYVGSWSKETRMSVAVPHVWNRRANLLGLTLKVKMSIRWTGAFL